MKHNQKPALLLLTSSFPASPGDETCGYVRDFARALAAEFTVTVLAPSDKKADAWPADSFELTRSRSVLPRLLDPFQSGADLNHLASGSLLAKLGALISLVCFFGRALSLALRADAICSHWMVPCGLVGALIGRLLGKPHIVVEHSGALHLLMRRRGGRRITRFIVERSDRIVTVSAELRRKLIAMCPDAVTRVEVVPMGVNLAPAFVEAGGGGMFYRSDLPSPTILFIGRLTEIKGLDVLLNAIEGLDDLRLIVAGEGERRDELETLARNLSLEVRFIGRIDAAVRRQLLSTCEIVVIPSRVLADGRTEGTPVVCLEAMAAGRVVVASKVGGLAEVINDGENGLLFDPDDHRMLRDKLLLGLGDSHLRRGLAANALRSAAVYDWGRIGLRYGAIIKSSLGNCDAIGNRRIEADSFSE